MCVGVNREEKMIEKEKEKRLGREGLREKERGRAER